MQYDGHVKELSGAEPDTTNNRMELTAAIRALREIRSECDAHVTTDSTYVMQGITQWMERWRRNGWRTAGKKSVRNVDLWLELDDVIRVLRERHKVSVYWHWTRGHAGHAGNERADALAYQAAARCCGERDDRAKDQS